MWFNDLSTRTTLIDGFKYYAKKAYVDMVIPTLFEALSKSGDSEYRHEHSSWFKTGFCIKATSGAILNKTDMLYIGKVILMNHSIMRKLYLLGYDTLFIGNPIQGIDAQWAVKEFID